MFFFILEFFAILWIFLEKFALIFVWLLYLKIYQQIFWKKYAVNRNKSFFWNCSTLRCLPDFQVSRKNRKSQNICFSKSVKKFDWFWVKWHKLVQISRKSSKTLKVCVIFDNFRKFASILSCLANFQNTYRHPNNHRVLQFDSFVSNYNYQKAVKHPTGTWKTVSWHMSDFWQSIKWVVPKISNWGL